MGKIAISLGILWRPSPPPLPSLACAKNTPHGIFTRCSNKCPTNMASFRHSRPGTTSQSHKVDAYMYLLRSSVKGSFACLLLVGYIRSLLPCLPLPIRVFSRMRTRTPQHPTLRIGEFVKQDRHSSTQKEQPVEMILFKPRVRSYQTITSLTR